MPVFQDSGGGLGSALLNFGQNYLAGRQQKRQDQLFLEELADRLQAKKMREIGMAQQGIHMLAPGELPPMKDMANDIADRVGQVPGVPMGLPSMDMNGGQPNAPQMASRAGAGAANLPGRPQSSGNGQNAAANDPNALFRSLMQNMGGAQPHGARFETGNGYYIDHKPQWDQQDAARSQKMQDQFEPMIVQRLMAQQDRADKIQRWVAAGVPAERAGLYVDNPSLAENDPTVGKPRDVKGPVMGSPEWLAARRAELKMEADFRPPQQTPAMTQVGVDGSGHPVFVDPRNPNRSVTSPASVVSPKQNVAPTEFSNKAALVYPRAEQAAKILDDYFTRGAPGRSVLGGVPLVGNFMVGDDAQKMNQAAETVASAILRLESGAAISQDEIRRYARQFLPQPGDSDETRNQKRATLQTQLERLKVAAQPSIGSGSVPLRTTPPPTGGDTAISPFASLIPRKP